MIGIQKELKPHNCTWIWNVTSFQLVKYEYVSTRHVLSLHESPFSRNGSDSSGSMGVFFQKRPNAFSTERPGGDNNNKPGVSRQDSSIYAEIDEGMVRE